MKKPFCCESSRNLFEQYYDKQQRGEGDFPVFIGRHSQRGHGLGDIFKGLMRKIMPIIKGLAPHALRAGANVIDDISSGTNWKTAAARRGPETIKAYMESRKKQTGSGRGRRRIIKRRKRDIFS